MNLNLKRIYIIEDNIFNRLVFQAALTLSGAIIEFDRTGREAIQRLHHAPYFDLIVLDLMLPHAKSGYDLIAEFRAVDRYQSVPIVAVSAAEAGQAIPRAQALGFNGFIPKPIDEGLFAEQLQHILDGQSIWMETGSALPGKRSHNFS